MWCFLFWPKVRKGLTCSGKVEWCRERAAQYFLVGDISEPLTFQIVNVLLGICQFAKSTQKMDYKFKSYARL